MRHGFIVICIETDRIRGRYISHIAIVATNVDKTLAAVVPEGASFAIDGSVDGVIVDVYATAQRLFLPVSAHFVDLLAAKHKTKPGEPVAQCDQLAERSPRYFVIDAPQLDELKTKRPPTISNTGDVLGLPEVICTSNYTVDMVRALNAHVRSGFGEWRVMVAAPCMTDASERIDAIAQLRAVDGDLMLEPRLAADAKTAVVPVHGAAATTYKALSDENKELRFKIDSPHGQKLHLHLYWLNAKKREQNEQRKAIEAASVVESMATHLRMPPPAPKLKRTAPGVDEEKQPEVETASEAASAPTHDDDEASAESVKQRKKAEKKAAKRNRQ